ncbi:nucleoside deaminase [Desulfoluna spongiiphila]|uniref:tRNA(Adenine34) deaminase n=1 Tax=Desulfoluna spongiiphila TaxID=419481 RepID=A0A1G5GNU1_9BACT|nr:nucleoside deaminase [Desulfoluna spongiiphila]SCY53213.1 tRNA(adenine34) deaminase [Desulfoluna spongiiphila]VVS92813.1 cytidine deaminase-like [Desulfoluna spongiiphila]
MRVALDEAEKALEGGDFPVGCIVVARGRVVATGRRSGTAAGPGNELDHAEVTALRCLLESGGLPEGADATLYCTMEPCLMCFGAILLSGVSRVVWAYEDAMGGGASCDLASVGPLYAQAGVEVRGRVLRKESLALFKSFFANPDNGYWKDSFLEKYTLEAV